MAAEVRATIATVDRAVYRTDRHASVNLIYHSLQHWRPRRKKRREQNLIVCSGKYEAEVTNNRRLRSTYCTIEANYWHTRSIARPVCNSRATCPVAVGMGQTDGQTDRRTYGVYSVIRKPREGRIKNRLYFAFSFMHFIWSLTFRWLV